MPKIGSMVFRSISLFVIFCIVNLSTIVAQKFIVSVDNANPKTYVPVQLSFNFVNMKASKVSLPKLEGMRILNGPHQYTSSSTINGVTTGSNEVVYEIMFTKPGKYVFPRMYAKNGNSKVASNVLSVSVGQGKSPFPPGYEGKEGLVVLKESKKTAYLGECISIDLILYSISNSVSITGAELPEFNDGWVQDVKGPQNEKFVLDRYNGKSYFKFDYAKIWLVPFKTGKVVYDPVRVIFNLYVRIKSEQANNIYNQSYDELQLPFDIESNEASFEITDLPSNGKPVDFVNAIGDYTAKFSIDKSMAKVNESIRLKLNISGTGNFPVLAAPTMFLDEGFETFEPKVKDNYKVKSDGITGSKEFEYYIVPRKEGDFFIGPVKFSFFDPKQKTYKTILSDSFKVNIHGFIADTTTNVSVLKDGIYNNNKPYKLVDPFFGRPLYYILLGIPFILGVGFIVFRKRIFFSQPDIHQLNFKNAEMNAKRQMAEIKSGLNNTHSDELISSLSNVFLGYLAHKLGVVQNEISRSFIRDKITYIPIRGKIESIYDELDLFKFSPSTVDNAKSLIDKIEGLIDLISKNTK